MKIMSELRQMGTGSMGIGEGTSLQYSCLENPTDGGAWWAAVHGVTKSQTRLKRLSSSSSSIMGTVYTHLKNHSTEK